MEDLEPILNLQLQVNYYALEHVVFYFAGNWIIETPLPFMNTICVVVVLMYIDGKILMGLNLFDVQRFIFFMPLYLILD